MPKRRIARKFVLLTLSSVYCFAATTEQTILLHLVEQANVSGFSDLRGKDLGSNDWQAVTLAVGFDFCAVSWKDAIAYYGCDSSDRSKAQSREEVSRMVRVVEQTFPNWIETTDNGDDEHLFWLFKENGGSRRISLGSDPSKKNPGVFHVGLQIQSAYTAARAATEAAQGKKSMAEFVMNDARLYVSAAQNAFASFKQGEAKARSSGGRWWTSSERPWLAESCEIQEPGNGTTLFFCVLTRSAYKEEVFNRYVQLREDITAALPGWKSTAQPFNNVVASHGFSSATGVTGQIWLAAESNGTFTLNYQVVSPRTS